MRNTYGPNTIGDGITYGKQDTGGVNKVLLMGHKEIGVLSFFM